MKARRILNEEVLFPDGSVVSVVVWKLPEPTQERLHGYKYRLNYYTLDGITLIRYDNRQGKGDHKHILNQLEPYFFENLDQLLADFWQDVFEISEKIKK